MRKGTGWRQETRGQVKKELRILERTRSALIREISMGAWEMRLMGVRLYKMTEPIQDDCCDQRISDGKVPMRHRGRSSSPKMKTRIQDGKTLDETDKKVMNLKDEYAGRI